VTGMLLLEACASFLMFSLIVLLLCHVCSVMIVGNHSAGVRHQVAQAGSTAALCSCNNHCAQEHLCMVTAMLLAAHLLRLLSLL
jgi:hypothetical protein